MTENNENNQDDSYLEEEHKYSLKDLPGVGEATLNKLKQAGFLSIRSIAVCPLKTLTEDAGLGEKTAEKIIRESQDKESEIFKIKTASEVWEKRKNLKRITTGSQNFDEILSIKSGGIEPGSLTEIFGEYRTGKTQLCHQLCVNVQLPYEKGGLEGNAYYIDTHNSFRPERIIQMSEYLDLDPNEVLNNIIVSRAYNSDHQISLVKEATPLISEHGIKLLVLDNIIGHFKSEYYGRGMFDLFRDLLRAHLTDLQRLTNIYPNLAVIYTNQVKIMPDVFYGNPIAPLGGNVIAHAPSTRLFLRKGKGEQRIAKLVKSSCLPESDAVFSITEGGIGD